MLSCDSASLSVKGPAIGARGVPYVHSAGAVRPWRITLSEFGFVARNPACRLAKLMGEPGRDPSVDTDESFAAYPTDPPTGGGARSPSMRNGDVA